MLFTWERAMDKSVFWEKRFADHLERYNFAKKYCVDKTILDIASGSWYGTKILSMVAKKTYGIDVSSDAISFCKENIKWPDFILWNGKDIPLEDNSLDVVVSFETIEHIKYYEIFLSEIKRVLKPWWTLIMSTPNFKWEIWKNKRHVSNLNHKQFISAVAKYFKIEKELFQWKHFYPFPGRGILETILWIKRDIKIHEKRQTYDHHVSMLVARNVK